jgi:hypothetical protein
MRIAFDPLQKDLYDLQVKFKRQNPGCKYLLFHSLKGKGRHGEFPLMVVREHFRNLGYKVLFSSSVRDTPESFICASYPGLRGEEPLHPAYMRMVRMFGFERLKEFNKKADKAKTKHKRGSNRGGGDPDMFVYKGNGRYIRFFVEAKHKDKLLTNQKVVFRLIRKHLGCPVRVVRIYSRPTTREKLPN